MPEKEKLLCHRCESKKPAKVYDPRTPGHPHKRINLCDECAARDPKAVLADDSVPSIDPAVPKEPEPATYTTETVPTPQNHVIPITNVMTKPEKSEESMPESISRESVNEQIAVHKKDLAKLEESRQAILAEGKANNERAREISTKMTNVEQMILVKRGAIASLTALATPKKG